MLAEATAAAGDSAGLIGVIGAACAAIGGGFGAFLTWLSNKRTNSGKVNTAPADVVFAQMQHIVDLTLARADKAEQQRDLLIESQGTKVAPAIAEISTGLTQLVAMDQQLAEMLREVQRLLKAKGPADGTATVQPQE